MPNIISYAGKILDQLADLLLPKGQAVRLLESLGPAGLAEQIPQAEKFDFETEKIKALFNYKNILCRQAIWEIKYRANKKLIGYFSLLLYDFILEEIDDLQTFTNFQNIILIPIPSSRSRTREKGFNQCLLLGQELIKIDRKRNGQTFILLENLLLKKTNTAKQSWTKNRQQRLENLKNTFTINNRAEIKNLRDYSCILIDDVITTGATMQEAFRALEQAGATKILGVSLAH